MKRFMDPRILVAVPAAALLLATAASASTGQARPTSAEADRCPRYQLETPAAGVGRQVIGIDVSASTRGGQLARLYEAAADGAIDVAAQKHLAVVIEAFTAASSSAQLVYAGSFAGSTGNETYDLANANRVSCQAKRAVHGLLTRRRTAKNTGTDVGGNLGELVARAHEAARIGKPAYVLDLTDGWTEPGRAGSGSHGLIDLRRLIDSGKPLAAIYRQHRAAFAIGDATGVAIAIKGIDRQSSGSLASSAHAKALTQLWTWACKDAHAKPYTVTEEVP